MDSGPAEESTGEFDPLEPSRDPSEASEGGSGLIYAILLAPVIFFGVSMVVAPNFILETLFPKKQSTEVEPQQVATETVTSTLDLSGVWNTMGMIGAGAGIALLSIGAFWMLNKARRSALAHRREQEAVAEDRRQALAVWQKFIDRHRTIKANVLEIETDWDLLFSYPALVDASVPQTLALHRALSKLDSASSIAPAGLNLSMEISELPYPKLVTEAQEAWRAAWSFAQRTGLKLIPRAERKKLDQISKLLELARNGGGSEHERSVAYSRISKLVGELQFVKVPEVAMQSIEGERRRMIEAPAGSAAATDPKHAQRVFAV